MTQLHVRIDEKVLEKFKAKLQEDDGHRANLTAVLQSWIGAYIDGRLEIRRE